MHINYIDDKVLKRAEHIEGIIKFDESFMATPIGHREKWLKYEKELDAAALKAKIAEYITESHNQVINYNNSMLQQSPPVNLMKTMRIIEQLTLAEAIENNGEYISYIVDYANYMCNVNTWVSPGHYSAFGYTGSEDSIELVDLLSSSFSWRFAVCDCILNDKLNDKLRNKIKQYIETKVLSIYKDAVVGKRALINADGRPPLFWLENSNNWLCVCISGAVASLLWYGENLREKAIHIALYEKMISKYLDAFKDGYSHEGLSYWGYGFSKFLSFSDLIGRLTNNKIDMFNSPNNIQTALFGFKSELSKGDYPAVSDCGFGEVPLDSNQRYAARRLNLYYKEKELDFTEDIHTVMMLLRWNEIERPKINMPIDLGKRTYYKAQGVLISRTDNMAIMIKGGNNIEPHNHNDLGSFIISVGGEQLIADAGYTQYVEQTFSKDRYKANALNSYGHSVPLPQGKMQLPHIFECDKIYNEVIYSAKVLNESFSSKTDTIQYDLTEVYDYPEIKSIVRTMTFMKESDTVEICDKFEYNCEGYFENAIITFAKVEVSGSNAIRIIGNKNSIIVRYPEDMKLVVDSIEGVVTDGHRVPIIPLRIGFRTVENMLEGECKLTIGLV